MHKAYLSAGSNLGDRKSVIEHAVQSLGQNCLSITASPYYETEPVGYLDQPWFLNLAIELETPLSPQALLSFCQGIENRSGRRRSFPNAPRILDLDILFFDDLILSTEDLVIPHPRIEVRRFVLEPLAQLAPGLIHPVLNKTIGELLAACPDTSVVRRFEDRHSVQ